MLEQRLVARGCKQAVFSVTEDEAFVRRVLEGERYRTERTRVFQVSILDLDGLLCSLRDALRARIGGSSLPEWAGTLRMKTEARDLVNDLYMAGRHDAIFKGEWYSYFLCEDAERIAKTHEIGKIPQLAKLLESHLASHLKANLSCETEWAGQFTAPLERIMEKIKADNAD